jgi:putative aldouronate transport system substrate-binding protein
MKKKVTSFTAVAMAVAMAGTMLTGCGSSSTEQSVASSSEAASQASSSSAAESTASSEETPAETTEENSKPYAGTKLTWWTKLNSNVSANYENLADTPWAQYVMEQTGIEIEFIHPVSGSESEDFAIMLADGDYPDIIEWTWTTYSGGPGAAIDEGVILNLNDVMANSPNMQAVLAENPEIERMIKTSDGDFYCYPFLRGTESPNATQFSNGLILRKDVLDELGLEMPETIDEWDTVLRAFKEAGFETPFVTRSEWMKQCWAGGFDNWGDFYVDDGVVKNGLIEDSRKELISKLHEWYEDGLISKDWLVADKSSNQYRVWKMTTTRPLKS